MKVNCTTQNADNITYTVSAIGPGGGKKSAYICNSNGNNSSISGSGDKTFYVKVPMSEIDMDEGYNGVSKITLNASADGISEKSTKKAGYIYYDHCWCQTIRTVSRYDVYEFEDETETSVSDYVSWSDFNVWLDVTKVDKNDHEKKLGNVEFYIRRGSGKYLKVAESKKYSEDPKGYDDTNEWVDNKNNATVFATDADGHCVIKNLRGGIYYSIIEKSNNNYGYGDDSLDTFIVTSDDDTNRYGKIYKVTAENSKNTGNILIQKKDKDTNEPLEGVSFKIKKDGEADTSSCWVNVTNGKATKGTKSGNTYTGEMWIEDMKFDSKDNATIFITNNEGVAKIKNILSGDYEVVEISVGDNYLYEVSEDEDENKKFISWEYYSAHHADGKGTYINETPGSRADVKVYRRSSVNTGEETSAYERYHITNPTEYAQKYPQDVAKGLYGPYDYVIFRNKRKYIDLSGYVWVDDYFGKQTERNDLYNNDDELLNGIPVRLKRGDGEVTILDATALSKHLNGTHVIPEIEPHGLGDVNNDGIVNEADRQMIQQYLAEMIQLTEEEKIRADIDQSDKETGFATTTKTLNRYSTDEKKTGDGEYYFRRVPIYGSDGVTNILDKYYIEFEYNGIIYQNVNPNIGENKGSKAIERTADRNQFHSDFSTIEGKGESEPDKGIAKDGNIDLTYELEKNNDGIGRKAIQNNYYRMKANTANASYNIKTNATIEGNKFKKEVRYINLGLYKREQPDLETTSDVINMQAKIRGYEYTYDKMGQRASNSQYIEDETNHNNAEDSKGIADELKHQFDLSTSFGLKYGPNDYTEYLYASDIQRSKDTTNDDKLEVYVKYKVQFKNKSTNLDSTVNEFINFFDSRYEKVESIEEESGNIIGESEYKVESYNDKYKKLTITKPQNIDRQSSKFVYITFKLSDNGINAILIDDAELQDISEISSYSTYKSGSHYGGIDKDSNPGNSKPADKESKDFEDDTDFAPGLKISIKQREITGTIWEDSVAKNNAIEGVLGDGIYNAGENVFENVKVELLEEDGGTYKNAELYKYEGGATSNVVMTNKKGEYTFSGVLPGKYIVRYSYGNTDEVKSVIYDSSQNKVQLKDSYNNPIEFDPDNYKSTIFKNNTNPNWYAEGTSISKTDNTRYSDARDKYATKKDGTKIEDIVEFRTKTGGAYEYDQIINYEEAIKPVEQKTISAETNKFDVRIENNDDNNETSSKRRNDITKTEEGKRLTTIIYDQMDFGIIRRAKPKLKMSKTIIWIEVTLANGQTIIAGNPQEEEIKYLKRLPNGDVTIELDNELIQGAKLKVKYNINANTEGAETDYLDENYYLYGTIPADRDGTIKKIQIERIHDYPQSGFVFDASIAENNKYWDMYDETHIISDTGKLISNDVAKDITDGHFYILKTKEKYSLKPGEDKNITLELTKVLANSEDISLDNGVEVIVLKNKKIENSIPGNYKPASQGPKEYDSDNAYLSVTAPTGKTDHTQEIVIISISLLIILGTGIVFIKKKILNNKGGN